MRLKLGSGVLVLVAMLSVGAPEARAERASVATLKAAAAAVIVSAKATVVAGKETLRGAKATWRGLKWLAKNI